MNTQSIYNEIAALQAGSPESMLEKVLAVLQGHDFDQPDFHATVGVDEIQAIADEEISRELTAAEIELVYADVRRNYNWDDGLSFENFRIAIAQLDEE